jgi:hypothetical protein
MHDDEIDVHWDERRGRLFLSCERDAFGRIAAFAAQQAAAGGENIIADKIKYIVVIDESVRQVAPQSSWQDRLALLACGVVAALALIGVVILAGVILGR